MAFVIGILAALLIVFLLSYAVIKKPKFGGALIVVSLLMIALSIFFYFQKDKRVEKRASLIPIEQIKLSNLDYEFAYGTNYKLTATVKNNSPRYRLQWILIKVSFLHCQSKLKLVQSDNELAIENCEVLQTKEQKVPTRLGSQSSSNIETYVALDKNKVWNNRQELTWKVELTGSKAR